MNSFICVALVVVAIPVTALGQITGTFVAAQDGVNSFQSIDGSSLMSAPERTVDLWHERVGVFNIASITPSGAYQGQDKGGATPNPTATEVQTTITGLTPGVSYDIYVIMGISISGSSGSQPIDAGFVSGELETWPEGGATNTGLELGAGDPWFAAEQLIGSAVPDESGELVVYVNTTTGGERSIYNGLSYIESPPPGPVGHYWDFTVDLFEFPVTAPDLFGSLELTEIGFIDAAIDPDYGEAFVGAGASLNSLRAAPDYFLGDTFNGAGATSLDFGMDDFAISYWVYDDGSDNDPGGAEEDLRGARVLDCADGTNGGIEISVTAEAYFSLRVDDLEGNQSLSVEQAGTIFETLVFPTDAWVHVAINVDRGNERIEVYFDGVSQGTYSIANLLGEIACTQDLQVGVINGGEDANGSQKSGLDDLSIYPALLTGDNVAALVAATTTPLVILNAMSPPETGGFEIASITYDQVNGVAEIKFPSVVGETYTVQGSADMVTWDPLEGTDTSPIDGTDGEITFDHTPGVGAYHYRVLQN